MARIRELTRADIPSAVELLAGEPSLNPSEAANLWASFVEESLGREILFLAEEESVLSGLVCFYPEPILASGAFVRFLVVRPEMRRRGIGRQLIGFVERKISRRTADMYLCIPLDNESGVKFLDRMGYIKDSEISASPNDPRRWSIMRKSLGSNVGRHRVAGRR